MPMRPSSSPGRLPMNRCGLPASRGSAAQQIERLRRQRHAMLFAALHAPFGNGPGPVGEIDLVPGRAAHFAAARGEDQ